MYSVLHFGNYHINTVPFQCSFITLHQLYIAITIYCQNLDFSQTDCSFVLLEFLSYNCHSDMKCYILVVTWIRINPGKGVHGTKCSVLKPGTGSIY